MIKVFQWAIRIPLTIVLLFATPLMWLISFSVDGVEKANLFAKDFIREVIHWNF